MKSLTLRLEIAGVPTAGRAGDITFRKSPYATPGDLIGGLTVTDTLLGSYTVTGFTTWNDDTKAYLSGVAITSFSVKATGSIFTNFLNKFSTTAQTILSDIAMSTKKLTGLGAGTTAGDSVRYEQVPKLATDNTYTGNNYFGEIPQTTVGRTYNSSRQVADIEYLLTNYGTGSGSPFGIASRRLFVDSQATAVAGKIYTTIQSAITYAVTQTPSVSSQWYIIIMGDIDSGYAEDITLSKFIHLIGWGDVIITGGLTTSHVTTAQTWTARHSSIENLNFNGTDDAMYVRLLNVKNCILRANGAGGEVVFYIDGSNLIGTGIYTLNDVDLQANNTEQENRAVNCFGNEEPVWETTDKVYSFFEDTTDQWEYLT